MVNKTVCITSIIIAMLLAFTGCSSSKSTSRPTISLNNSYSSTVNIGSSTLTSTGDDGNNVSAELKSTNLTEKLTFLSTIDEKLSDDSKLPNTLNKFGLDILRKVSAKDENNNIIISPLSMFTEFSLLSNGAAGETKSQMKKAMNIENYEEKTFNDDMYKVISRFSRYEMYNSEKFNVGIKSICNSLWIDEGFNVKDSFLEMSRKYYNSDIFKTDFRRKSTVNDMNSWISSKTGGLVEKQISQVDPSMKMTLFNVLHFRGKWDWEFDKSKTQSEVFHLKDGNNVTVNMMNNEEIASYYEDESVQIGGLPFDNNAEMLVMLPKGDMDRFVENLNSELVMKYINNSIKTHLKLKMPQFNIEYKKLYRDTLESMGIKSAFNDEKADFSGITNNRNSLSIDDVLQYCSVKVDEEGVEAGALTAIVEMGAESSRGDKELYLDRPFLFVIIDQLNNLIMFAGKVENPYK